MATVFAILKVLGMRRYKWLLLSWFIIEPAAAHGIPVPPDCVELAIREGYPTDTMTEAQAKRAKVRLIWLRVRYPRDEIIKKCAIAVIAVRAARAKNLAHESQ